MSLRIPGAPRFIDPLLVRAMRENQEAWRRLLERVPMLDGRLVEVEDVSAGTFTVEHGFGRKPRGFVVVDWRRPAGSGADSAIYRRTDDELSASVIELYATDAFDSAKIWVW